MPMDTIKIVIPSITENIRIIESFIDNAKEKFNLNDDIYGNIMIAVTVITPDDNIPADGRFLLPCRICADGESRGCWFTKDHRRTEK